MASQEIKTSTWVESLVTIADRFRLGGDSILRLFEDAGPDLSDRSAFEAEVARRLRQEVAFVEAWQAYSSDKRIATSPYLEGVEVDFYDGGRHEEAKHPDEGVGMC